VNLRCLFGHKFWFYSGNYIAQRRRLCVRCEKVWYQYGRWEIYGKRRSIAVNGFCNHPDGQVLETFSDPIDEAEMAKAKAALAKLKGGEVSLAPLTGGEVSVAPVEMSPPETPLPLRLRSANGEELVYLAAEDKVISAREFYSHRGPANRPETLDVAK